MTKEETEILKAKVDFHKTFTIATMTANLTSVIGYWANVDNPLARWIFMGCSISFGVAFILFLMMYVKRHQNLIVELRK